MARRLLDTVACSLIYFELRRAISSNDVRCQQASIGEDWELMTQAESVEPDTNRPGQLYGSDLIREFGFLKIVKEDFHNHYSQLTAPGFYALFVYRLGTLANMYRNKLVRWPLLTLYVLGQRFVRNFFGIEIFRHAKIGRRLNIGHQHGIVIHEYATIGDDVIIRHSVTFGVGTEWITGVGPIIGNRVTFSPGCVVVGNITIGDDVSVGPNCTITQDVPAGRTLFMPPPRSLPKQEYAKEQ